MNGKILEIKNIYAGYDKRRVLFGINMEIKKGEKILLIGPNGSGKSTLMKVIFGILKPEKGNVIYEGKDITLFSPEKRVKMGIGYLVQGRNVFNLLSVKENLEIAGYGLKKEEIKESMERVINYFPFLKGKLNIRAGLLSGGERKALAICMVLMKKKKLLLLDEPLAGLSPAPAKEIVNVFEKIKEMENITILIVEHNLKIVMDKVDKVYAMRAGEIIKFFEDPKKISKEDIEKIFFVAER
jgi:branched-chain amino acid transport system ATP-binding protein